MKIVCPSARAIYSPSGASSTSKMISFATTESLWALIRQALSRSSLPLVQYLSLAVRSSNKRQRDLRQCFEFVGCVSDNILGHEQDTDSVAAVRQLGWSCPMEMQSRPHEPASRGQPLSGKCDCASHPRADRPLSPSLSVCRSTSPHYVLPASELRTCA